MEVTSRLGLWIDTTSLDVKETVAAILDDPDASRVVRSDLSLAPRPF